MLRRIATISLIVLFGCTVSAIRAFGQNNGNPKLPQVLLDDGSGQTPLAKGLMKHTQKLRDDVRTNKNNPHYNPNCQDPTSDDTWDKKHPDTRDGKNSKLQKAKTCNVAALDVVTAADPDNCPDCGASDLPTDSNGNKTGKQMKNKTTVYYDNPSERVDRGGLAYAHDANGKLLKDDKGNPVLIPQGNPLTSWPGLQLGAKRKNSQSIEDNTYFNDPKNMNPTNLSKLNVSHFQDNMSSDPLFGSNCTDLGGSIVPQPTALPPPPCDLTQAAITRANNAWKNRPNPQPNDPENMFDVDVNGKPTDSSVAKSNGAMHWGEEGRQQNISETYAIHCPAGFAYTDDGQCAKPVPTGAPSDPAAQCSVQPDGTQKCTAQAMMGFTFAPPKVSWSWGTDESVCVWGFCFTIFSANIGYDFDVAAGLRLPVQLDFSNVPTTLLANNTASFSSTLTAKNFSQDDYKKFCQDNGMVDGFIISSCDRFSFPEHFSSLANSADSNVTVDGKELVAQAIISAYANATVLEVKILDINITAGSDYSTDLTALNIISSAPSELVDALHSTDSGAWNQGLLNELNGMPDPNTGIPTARNYNLSSFTPPFTTDPDQFLTGTFHFDADCTKAQYVDHLYLTPDNPICTGLAVNYYGATLGVGLTVTVGAGSSLIKTDWSATGDSCPASATCPPQATATTVNFNPGYAPSSNPAAIGTIDFDNFDSSTDSASVSLNNFTFCVNEFTVELDADLEFGGILSPIPSLPSFPIFKFNYSGGPGECVIPIGQHNATGPITFSVPVTNYAISIAGSPGTLSIKPGTSGSFNIMGTNLGTAIDDVNNFNAVTPDYSGNQWTDVDGNPVSLPAGWTASFTQTPISDIPAHSISSGHGVLSVSPVKLPLTAPGTYPVKITADSKNGKLNNLPLQDPMGNYRIGAPATVSVTVLPFADPRIKVTPATSSGKPTTAQNYDVQGQNFGNVPLTENLTLAFPDSNTAGCTLTTLGKSTGCPYRAFVTAIPQGWTSAATFPTIFPVQPTPPPAQPLPLYQFGSSKQPQTADATLSITVPSDWAGMQDTKYTWTVTATSTASDGDTVSSVATVTQTVQATKQSMTRYIGLEIADMINQINAANAAGYNTGGLLPLFVHPIQSKNDDALADILAGNFSAASTKLATEMKLVGAMQHMLAGGIGANLPMLADFQARAQAMLNDLSDAQVSNITSNP